MTAHCLMDLDVGLSPSSTACWGEEKYKPEDNAGTESMEVAAMSAKPRRLKKAGESESMQSSATIGIIGLQRIQDHYSSCLCVLVSLCFYLLHCTSHNFSCRFLAQEGLSHWSDRYSQDNYTDWVVAPLKAATRARLEARLISRLQVLHWLFWRKIGLRCQTWQEWRRLGTAK